MVYTLWYILFAPFGDFLACADRMAFTDTLEGYGFTKKEALVYLSALELGHAPAASIARHSGLNRTTVYDILEILKKKGVATCIKKHSTYYYSVILPDLLFQDLQKRYIGFQQELSALMNIAQQFGNRPKVQFFEGVEGVKQMYAKALESGAKTVKAFLGVDTIDPLLLEFLDTHFIPRRLDLDIYAYVIGADTHDNRAYQKKDAIRKKETKLIPTETLLFNCQIDMYDTGEVYFIGGSTQNMFGIMIQNPFIYESMVKLFDFIWEGKK